MGNVVEINDVHLLAAYRQQWDALLPETPHASFFHTFDWFCNYWRHYGHDQKLRVLIVRAAGEVIGIVPLVIKRQQHRLTDEAVLTYPLDDWGMWYGPLGRNAAATWHLAARHLAHTPRDWDAIRLPWITEPSDHGRTGRALGAAGFPTQEEQYQQTSIVEFNTTWDEYLQGLAGKTRHEIRRGLRRCDDLGNVTYTRYRPLAACAGDGEPRWDLYNACELVAQQSWQSGIDDGNTLCHPQHIAFYRDCHATAARLGMVDLNLLSLGSRPAAFCYNYHYQGTIFGLRMGYDPAVAQSGMGKALVAMMIRDSFERGDIRLEMGIGDQRYKREIRTGVATSVQLSHVPALSWRSHVIDWSRWCKRRWAGSAAAL